VSRPVRLALLLIGGVLLSTGGAIAQSIHFSDLRWTGVRPAFPLFRGNASGDFQGDVELRIATRSEPLAYRAHLAVYCLADALGSRVVPRTERRSIRLPELIEALRKDPVGFALLKDDLTILNNGTVTVLVSEAVTGGREIDFVTSTEVKNRRALAEGQKDVPPDRRAMVGEYVETLVLDYLAANVKRTTVTVGADASLHLTDNAGAFPEHANAQALDAILAQLRRVNHYPRRLIDRLRALERPQADQALHAGPFATWLIATRTVAEMMERRHAILSLIDARVAELGELSALAF